MDNKISLDMKEGEAHVEDEDSGLLESSVLGMTVKEGGVSQHVAD